MKAKRRRVLQAALGTLGASPFRWRPAFGQAPERGAGAGAQGGPQGLAGAASLLVAPRKALVIGNSAYAFGALKNPANDARAIAAELKRTGFEVTLGVDLTQAQMAEAIRSYAARVAQTKAIGLFYFAGHGVQLAWRNYILPTDAVLQKLEDIQAKCIDINAVIESIGRAANPMNVIILDACRDNPFAGEAKLEQKGLSQVDAPPGTLIAYATAPGNVASDGAGANGLYTEHLLREIPVPEAKIEDVFKRVRLAVRRESRGLQVPWESTSLEEDFWFIPPPQLKKLADEEAERARREEEAARQKELERQKDLERQKEAERARQEAERARQEAERARQEAERARQEADKARQVEAERIAREKAEAARLEQERLRLEQERLRREQAERERQEAERARRLAERTQQEEAERRRREQLALAALETLQKRQKEEAERAYNEEASLWERAATATEPGPLEDYLRRYPSGHFAELAQLQLDRVLAKQGEKKVEIAPQADNPYTKGSASVDADYKIGDTYVYSIKDAISRVEQRKVADTITGVTEAQVIYDGGRLITDRLGNLVRDRAGRVYSASQFLPGEFFVGKRWETRFTFQDPTYGTFARDYQIRITRKEKITVPAGTFDCYVLEGNGGGMNAKGMPVTTSQKMWFAPQLVRRFVARETRSLIGGRFMGVTEFVELVSYKQG